MTFFAKINPCEEYHNLYLHIEYLNGRRSDKTQQFDYKASDCKSENFVPKDPVIKVVDENMILVYYGETFDIKDFRNVYRIALLKDYNGTKESEKLGEAKYDLRNDSKALAKLLVKESLGWILRLILPREKKWKIMNEGLPYVREQVYKVVITFSMMFLKRI